MRKKHNLRLARAIQGISGVLAVLMIYPLVRLIYPCWRRLKGPGNHGATGGKGNLGETGGPDNHGETGGPGNHGATGGPHSSGPSEPTGKSTTPSK